MKKKCDRTAGFRWVIISIMIVVILLSLAVMLVPQLNIWKEQQESQQTVIAWKDKMQIPVDVTSPDNTTKPIEDPDSKDLAYQDLLNAMKHYNREIYLSGQAELADAWSYQEDIFNLSEYGIEDEIAGVISIPDINLELPLYLGATYDHLAKGFAQLSQTSMPIGGENTNCVVACHRGWRGMPYMRDVELLSIGDSVYVQNLWEVLEYRIAEIIVIRPDETESAYIQPERDLLTIVTCHPYGVGSHRYLLICERYMPETEEENQQSNEKAKWVLGWGNKVTVTSSEGIDFEPSQNQIFWQFFFPWICLAAIVVLLLITAIIMVVRAVYRRRKKKQF